MKFLIALSLSLLFSGAALAYSCTIADIKANNPKFCDDLREQTPMTEAAMRELFTEIQQSMREFILKGRRVDQLSDEEKSIYARIGTVEFAGFKKCENDPQGRPSVNASYSTTNHNVTFCEGLKDYPIPALVTMIGHEIGHSGDSCSVQCYHVQAQNRSRLRLPNSFLRSADNDPDTQRELRSSNQPIMMTTRFLMRRPDIVQSWRGADGVTINEPMPLKRYPLNYIRRCLIDQEKIWEAPEDEASHEIARSRDTGPGCKSHTDSESMADVWGAYALGKYFDKHPEKRGAQALGMFESRKKELCSPKSYPQTVSRLESIWIAAPGVAQALGCTPVVERSCMNRLPFPASQAAPPGSTAILPQETEDAGSSGSTAGNGALKSSGGSGGHSGGRNGGGASTSNRGAGTR